MRISAERKEVILSKLLPPSNQKVAAVSLAEGISESTLYSWLSQLRAEGKVVPGSKSSSEKWSPETKFMTVVRTSGMNVEELSIYCREQGLYVEQVSSWKLACIEGTRTDAERRKQDLLDTKKDKAYIKALEKELRRKEAALAETAALLVLRKKLNAYYLSKDEDA